MIKKHKNQQFYLYAGFKTAPNIGIIKYWGKWHEKEIIPLNDNIGVTLDQKDMSTLTKLKISTKHQEDSLTINGQNFQLSNRIKNILHKYRQIFNQLGTLQVRAYKNDLAPEEQDKKLSDLINFQKSSFTFKSINSFPTGSGLASSSSGLSALALCLNNIFDKLQLGPEFDVRYISRLGSGSSCRCVFGNFVYLPGVTLNNLNNSLQQEAVEYESRRCLPYEIKGSAWVATQCQILILVEGTTSEKDVLSAEGMKRTWETSSFIRDRVEKYSFENCKQFIKATENQDYNKLMEVIIKDSNQFHATCMDTYPPLFYLNEFSQGIINLVHSFNKGRSIIIGYTFDAGSHAVLFVHNELLDIFITLLSQIYDFSIIKFNENGKCLIDQSQKVFSQEKKKQLKPPSQIILTKIGQGPIQI